MRLGYRPAQFKGNSGNCPRSGEQISLPGDILLARDLGSAVRLPGSFRCATSPARAYAPLWRGRNRRARSGPGLAGSATACLHAARRAAFLMAFSCRRPLIIDVTVYLGWRAARAGPRKMIPRASSRSARSLALSIASRRRWPRGGLDLAGQAVAFEAEPGVLGGQFRAATGARSLTVSRRGLPRGASSPTRQGVTDSPRSLKIFADHLSETALVTDAGRLTCAGAAG